MDLNLSQISGEDQTKVFYQIWTGGEISASLTFNSRCLLRLTSKPRSGHSRSQETGGPAPLN